MIHMHAAHVVAHLGRGGLTLDMFRRHLGDALKTDKAGNGDTYYDYEQVMAYYAEFANVPRG